MLTRITKTAAAACLLTILLGACGDDGDSQAASDETAASTQGTADEDPDLDSAFVEDPGVAAGDSDEFCAIYTQIPSATGPDEFFGLLADAEAVVPDEVSDDFQKVADALHSVEDVMRRNFNSDSAPSAEDVAAMGEVTAANAEVDARLMEYCATN